MAASLDLQKWRHTVLSTETSSPWRLRLQSPRTEPQESTGRHLDVKLEDGTRTRDHLSGVKPAAEAHLGLVSPRLSNSPGATRQWEGR